MNILLLSVFFSIYFKTLIIILLLVIICIISGLIYLEKIELNFYDLNLNFKKTILKTVENEDKKNDRKFK